MKSSIAKKLTVDAAQQTAGRIGSVEEKVECIDRKLDEILGLLRPEPADEAEAVESDEPKHRKPRK